MPSAIGAIDWDFGVVHRLSGRPRLAVEEADSRGIESSVVPVLALSTDRLPLPPGMRYNAAFDFENELAWTWDRTRSPC